MVTPAAGARPSVLSLNITSKSALYAAYMPFLERGGLFVPTTREYLPGDEIFMLVALMDGLLVRICLVGDLGGKVGRCPTPADHEQKATG